MVILRQSALLDIEDILPFSDLNHALGTADSLGHTQIVLELFAHGARVEDWMIPPTIAKGCLDTLQLFLDNGWDINSSHAALRRDNQTEL